MSAHGTSLRILWFTRASNRPFFAMHTKTRQRVHVLGAGANGEYIYWTVNSDRELRADPDSREWLYIATVGSNE